MIARRAFLLSPLLALAACGFHPLYSEHAQAIDDPALAAIYVRPITDRIGQQLELSLRDALNPRGLAVARRYNLNVALTVVRSDLGIQRDASATRGRIDIYASFVLTDASSGARLYSSRTQSTSAFNIVDDAYAAQVAEEDARTRTVSDLTSEIRTRLALFLRQRRAG